MLPCPEEISGATHFQILLGNHKAIIGMHQCAQPFPCLCTPVCTIKNTEGLPVSTTYPSPQLVQLGQAKAVRILHHHQCGIGHIYPHLNHGSGNQNIYASLGKV